MARHRTVPHRTSAARSRHDVAVKGWTVIVLWLVFVLPTAGTIVVIIELLPKVRHVRVPIAWIGLLLSLLIVAAGATVSWLRARRSEH